MTTPRPWHLDEWEPYGKIWQIFIVEVIDATGKSIHVDVYSKFGEFSASVRGYMY